LDIAFSLVRGVGQQSRPFLASPQCVTPDGRQRRGAVPWSHRRMAEEIRAELVATVVRAGDLIAVVEPD